MSDGGSDGDEPAIGDFLFGNLDENNKLDADYLDAEELSQLQAFSGSKFGLNSSLKGSKSKSQKGKVDQEDGKMEKDENAINYSDEEDLMEYSPKAQEIKDTSKRPFGASNREKLARNEKKKSTPALELPILAKNGEKVFLKFSQLFADPIETDKPELRRVKRRIQEDPLPQDDIESYMLAKEESDSYSEFSSQAESHSDHEEIQSRKGDLGSQNAKSERGGKKIEQSERKGTKNLVRVSSASFMGINLYDWENDIQWGDDEDEKIQYDEESENDGDPSVPQNTVVDADMIETFEDIPSIETENARSKEQQKPTPVNRWLTESNWEDDIQWDSEDNLPHSPVLPDMNDPHLIFQLLKPSDGENDVDKAAALVLDPMPKEKIASGPVMGKGKIFKLLARSNVSQDEEYAKKKGKKGIQATRHKHALPALQLATIPPRYWDKWDLWHRPKGLWVPLTSKGKAKVKEGAKSTVRIASLVGPAKFASKSLFKDVDLNVTTLNQLWDAMKSGKGSKFQDCATLSPSQIELWYKGSKPQAVPRTLPIAQSGVPLDANMELSLVVSGMRLVHSDIANTIPEANITTPIPVSIQKTRQLTANDGHSILLEYFEETPLLLSRPGMTVRTSTYYRSKDDIDSGPIPQGEKWETGAMEILGPSEAPPLTLGDIQPGQTQLTVECNMYRAQAKAHKPSYSDFLIVRAASGALSIREITGTIMVGQEEPLRRIPIPGSKESRDLEEARLVAYVMRELRRQKIKNDKKKNSEPTDLTITVRELMDLFPTLSDGVIRNRLANRCNCVPLKDDNAGTYKLGEGISIADERELRQLVRPEEWCGHERMETGLAELSQLGVTKHDRLSLLGLERFKTAAEQLSPPEVYASAIHELEVAIQNTPWSLTDNFVSAMRDGRGALALTGAGDPTSRGEGFSYFKEEKNRVAFTDKVIDPLAAIPRDGNITGTNNDLRRLTMNESKAVLLKLGLDEQSIKGLTRWQRISAVRDLSTAAAGEEEGEKGKIGSKFARVARTSMEEQQRARTLQAHQIFARQTEALAGKEEESESDDESWGDELEKELADGGEPNNSAQKKGGKRGRTDEDDELDDVEELRKSGFLAGENVSNIGKSTPKLEAKAGETRIKRTIKFMNANNVVETRVLYYTDKDKKATLNDFYRRDMKEAAVGFGKRIISGGGTWTQMEDNPNARKTKKDMTKVQCKACGQMGHYKSNKICPMYEQTYGKAAVKGKQTKPKLETEEPKMEPLKLTLHTGSLTSPLKRGQSMDETQGLRSMKSDITSPGSPNSKATINPRKHLGVKVLNKALSQARKILPEGVWLPFKFAVNKTTAPDYNQFIPLSDEIHLDKIEKRARNGTYQSVAEFTQDLDKIVNNARVYNTPGNGKYGGPAIVDWAEQVVDSIKQQLQTETLSRLGSEIETIIGTEVISFAQDNDEQPQAHGPGKDANLWVQCTKCKKWRRVSQKVNDETVPTSDDAPWHCSWDYERPGASCDNPEDKDE